MSAWEFLFFNLITFPCLPLKPLPTNMCTYFVLGNVPLSVCCLEGLRRYGLMTGHVSWTFTKWSKCWVDLDCSLGRDSVVKCQEGLFIFPILSFTSPPYFGEFPALHNLTINIPTLRVGSFIYLSWHIISAESQQQKYV